LLLPQRRTTQARRPSRAVTPNSSWHTTAASTLSCHALIGPAGIARNHAEQMTHMSYSWSRQAVDGRLEAQVHTETPRARTVDARAREHAALRVEERVPLRAVVALGKLDEFEPQLLTEARADAVEREAAGRRRQQRAPTLARALSAHLARHVLGHGGTTLNACLGARNASNAMRRARGKAGVGTAA